MKTRVFCVITQGELGGAQQFVLQLAHNLDRERFEFHVVWGSDSDPALTQQLHDGISYAIAHHLRRPMSPLHDIRAIGELRAMMRSWNPDVVLCISSKAGFVGSRAAHGLRRSIPNLRIIYRIGGWTFNDPWVSWKKALYIALEKLSARWKDIIVVNNEHDLVQANKLGITPRNSIRKIFNGIDPYLDFLSTETAREQLGRFTSSDAYPAQWVVGTIANLYPAKDITSLIHAAAHTPQDIRFVVIGDGEMRNKLNRHIARAGLERRFFLIGAIPDAYRYLKAFDIFVLPSLKEGFPWSVLEAMTAKVPVIATRVGAIPEMLEDYRSGIIVDPARPNQISHAIAELISDEKLRQELVMEAHQHVIAKFSLHEMIEQYERLFTESL